MAESTTTRFGLKRWTADSDTPDRTDFDGAHLEIATNVAGWLPDDTLANRPAAAPSNARFLFRATDTGLIYFSTGSAWSELSGTQIDVQTTAPSSPSTNDLWLDTDDESVAVTTQHNDLQGLTTGNPHSQYALIAHAASHSDGGAAEITVENLATASNDTALALKPNGSGGLEMATVGALAAAKTADESVTSSTTLQNDDHLFLSLAANTTYVLTGMLAIDDDSNGAARFKMDWAVPAGCTVTYLVLGYQGTQDSFGPYNGVSGVTLQSISTYNTTDGAGYLVHGVVEVGGTAGTLQLQWAQNTSDASAVTVNKGSYIMLNAA